MVIDIERLKVDESLWPEGATHALMKAGRVVYYRAVDFEFGSYDFWNGIEFYTKREHPPSGLIPRPKPADEWVDGLPPEGTECEFELHGGRYEWCQIKAHRGSGTWITTKVDDRVVRNDQTNFRPLRTQAEREREEVIEAAIKACPYPGSDSTRIDVEALYDANLLHNPAEEVGLVELAEIIRADQAPTPLGLADAILSTLSVTKKAQ